MATRESFPIVACRDLMRTRAFYAAVFGAAEDYRFPEDGTPEFLTMRTGSSTIGFADSSGPSPDGEPALPATGHAVDLCLYVDDLEGVLAAGVAHGADLVADAADMPWGERIAWLRDPEGILLLVIQAEPAEDG